MSMAKRPTLREARNARDLEAFIKEHEKDAPGDLDKIDEVTRRSVQGTSSEAPQSSPEASDDD